MGTIISPDDRFEWDADKDIANKADHGFSFTEILDVFDDPYFLEAYDRENSTMGEIRWKGIASFDRRIYTFFYPIRNVVSGHGLYPPAWQKRLKRSDMMKTIGGKSQTMDKANMTDERIAELQNFKTKNFSEVPVQTPKQLKEFKPKYPDARLYKPVKTTVQIRLDADVLEWLKHDGPGYQTRANAILRQAMLHSS
jgi:uncharacterized protein (DUF4415 family)/uncharacterized DUF497 family protein